MGRRDDWKKMQETMTETQTQKTSELDTVPEMSCSRCTKFKESSYGSDGRGSCSVLKTGSDISVNPPIIVTEGENGLITFFNKDASFCSEFDKLELVDTDGSECIDPSYQRAQRQMSSPKS